MRWAALAIACSLAGCGVALAESNVADNAPREPVRSQRQLELGTYEGVQWPIVNAPIDGPLPSAPASSEPRPTPPTRAGTRVLEQIDAIRDSLRVSSYQAHTK